MVTIAKLIEKIETRQPVENKSELADSVLTKVMTGFARLDKANSQQIGFLAQEKYADMLMTTTAGVAIVNRNSQHLVPATTVGLVVQSPYLAYASCSQLFAKQNACAIHPTAVIAKSATIAQGVSIGAYSVVGDNTNIGENTVIGSGVSIDVGCQIGKDCEIKANVSIAEYCQIGDDVRIHNGASIGSEGFGFAPTANPADGGELNGISQSGWERIAQLGRVVIGNHVRIGANTCIDRGAIEDTIIEDNVIIDNLVQVAHNVHIGAGTAIAAKTGIAGSANIGKRCIIGGAVGIAGHLSICDDVTVTAMSMISKTITQSGSYSSGIPAIESNNWRRAVVKLRQSAKK